MAETIENNVRRLIIDEMAVNPKYYEKMSELLDALIRQRKQEALDYKAYLARIVALTRQLTQPDIRSYPTFDQLRCARRALYDNLKDVPGLEAALVRGHRVAGGTESVAEAAALAVDGAIREVKKADWRGNRFKEREVRNAIQSVLGDDAALVDMMFQIVKSQRDD